MHELHLLLGELPIPIFSTKRSVKWISFNGNPEDIPYEAIDYKGSPKLPDLVASDGKLMEMDPESGPVYFDLEAPYRAFSPSGAISSEIIVDEIAWIFSKEPIGLTVTNLDNVNSKGSHRNFVIDGGWSLDLVRLADRLYKACEVIYGNCAFLKEGAPDKSRQLSLPKINESSLGQIFESESEARAVGAAGRRTVLDLLGLLNWLMTLKEDWYEGLLSGMYSFVVSLRLGQRAKRGCLFSLCRDWRAMNIAHLFRNDVPFHYSWTKEEEQEDRLFVYSEEFLKEYYRLSGERGNIPVPLEELPGYPQWRRYLARYDYYQQDTLLGRKRDWRRPRFYPDCHYHLVLGEGWGARDLSNRREIRSCAAQFNAMAANHKGKSHITFFAHYPLQRVPVTVPPPHLFPVNWFGRTDESDATREGKFYAQDPILVRERWKSMFAPKEGQTFSTFNGRELSSNERARSEADFENTDKRLREAPPFRGTSEGARPRGLYEFRDERKPLRDRLSSPTRGYQGNWRGDSGDPRRLEHDDSWRRKYQQVGSARRRTSRSMSPMRRQIREQTLQRRHGSATPPWLGDRGRESRSSTPPILRGRRARSSDSYSSSHSARSFEEEFRDISMPPLPTGLSDNTENRFFENMPEDVPMGNLPIVEISSDDPFDANATDPRQNYKFQPVTKTDYLAALMDWAPVVTEDDPHMDPIVGLVWDRAAIERGILVFDDPRAQIRMRAWSVIFKGVNSIKDLLTLAVRFAIPFNIFYKVADLHLLRNLDIAPMELRTFPSTLEPGFRETELKWQGGGVATRNVYMQQASNGLSRPHAGAFLMKGGLVNRVALWINPDLPRKLAAGPSTRVTEYYRGFVLRARVASNLGIGGEVSLTRDQVSDEEVRTLLGYINNGGPELDTSLFPSQWMLEQEIPGHFNGVMSEAAQSFFDNLLKEVTSEGVNWRTRSGWTSYLRRAGRSHFAPKDWPKDSDFEKGTSLLEGAFGGSWNLKPLSEILIPEPFLENLPGEVPY